MDDSLLSEPRWIRGYWAKTPDTKDKKKKKKQTTDHGPSFHPLAWHLLDVAAAAEALLEAKKSYRKTLRDLSKIDDEQAARRWVTFLCSLHDIGKFFQSFQRQSEETWKLLHGCEPPLRARGSRHDREGWLACFSWTATESGLLAAVYGDDLPDDIAERCRLRLRAEMWLGPVFGHHGVPVDQSSGPLSQSSAGLSEQEAEDVLDCVRWLRETLLPGGPPAAVFDRDTKPPAVALTNWLAGVVNLADAIGSNARWFPFEPSTTAPEAYWAKARQNAQEAVEEIGLDDPRVLPATGSILGDRSPTPMQAKARDVELPQGPQLWILEEPTGSGKTEAALILAQRMMEAELAQGLFFGLPTRATAESMFRRLRPEVVNWVAAPNRLDVLMIHGEARSSRFGEELEESKRNVARDDAEPEEASRAVSKWLTHSAANAMFADVGVGTLDEALHAVLPTRFQALRLLSLAGKVLVLDEVHAYDDYIFGLLGPLLRMHAQLGGSAIVLSATLPAARRQEIVDAFTLGLHLRQGGKEPGWLWHQEVGPTEYPSLVCVAHPEEPEVVPGVTAWERSRRTVWVELLHAEADVEAKLRAALREGRCAVWIRNTVADAQRAFRRFRDQAAEWQLDPDRIHLLHSRFTRPDRAALENRLVSWFGKESTEVERRGRLLIATQVAEQSLDLDFDEMASDLAYGDLLIQRAGRLCRHPRDARGNPLEQGPDQRTGPILHVLSPPFDAEPSASWCSGPMPGTAKVYEVTGLLWLTVRTILAEKGKLESPAGIPGWIEAIHGAARDEIPAAFQAAYDERREKAIRAENRVVKGAYSRTAAMWTLEEVRTREISKMVDLYLLRKEPDGKVRYFHRSEKRPWMDSAIAVPKSLIEGCPGVVPWKALPLPWRARLQPAPGSNVRYVALELLEEAPEPGTWVSADLSSPGPTSTDLPAVRLVYRADEGIRRA